MKHNRGKETFSTGTGQVVIIYSVVSSKVTLPGPSISATTSVRSSSRITNLMPDGGFATSRRSSRATPRRTCGQTFSTFDIVHFYKVSYLIRWAMLTAILIYTITVCTTNFLQNSQYLVQFSFNKVTLYENDNLKNVL